MTFSTHTKTKFTPSSTTHASLSHISNNAETVCHRVPPQVPSTAPESPVSRASSSPGVLRYFRNNIYKPWALGLEIQHSGNGTRAPAWAADPPQRAVRIVKCITLRGRDGTEVEKRNQSCRGKGRCLAACPQALLAHVACTIWSLKAKHGM